MQRVPETESQGRVHTSAATVAVLPVAKTWTCSSMRPMYGAIHTAQAERAVSTSTKRNLPCASPTSQRASLWNAKTAVRSTRIMSTLWRSLRTRLFEREREKQISEQAEQRKSLVSTGDRSAKIRTYNYPQGRVTDHRIQFTSHALTAIMGGDIEAVINALRLAEQAELLAAQT